MVLPEVAECLRQPGFPEQGRVNSSIGPTEVSGNFANDFCRAKISLIFSTAVFKHSVLHKPRGKMKATNKETPSSEFTLMILQVPFLLATCFTKVKTRFMLLPNRQVMHLFNGKSKTLQESCSLPCNEAIIDMHKLDPHNDWPLCLWSISEVK